MVLEAETKPKETVYSWLTAIRTYAQGSPQSDPTPVNAQHLLRIKTARYIPNLGEVKVEKTEDGTHAISVESINFRALIHPHGQEELYAQLLAPLYRVAEQFGRDEVEYDVTVDKRADLTHGIDDFFWDSWKRDATMSGFYSKQVYPQVISAIDRNQDMANITPLTVVDIFGGDGEFVLEAWHRLPNKGQIYFHIIDRNQPSLDEASSKFAGTPNVTVHSPQDLTAAGNLFDCVREKPNIVTAIGGLCFNVVSRREALAIAQKVHAELASGGIFVVTGYTSVLLNSVDFREIGFSILETSAPQMAIRATRPEQLYVLRKS